jgi:hypothetical protein
MLACMVGDGVGVAALCVDSVRLPQKHRELVVPQHLGQINTMEPQF